jgi:IS605 OrfB family transposase
VKIVVQVELLPSPDEAAALAATLHAVNVGADMVSAVAFEKGVTSRDDLQRLVYGRLKGEFGLGAQAAVRTVKKVVDAYAALAASVRAACLGPEGSKRRAKATAKPVVFRREAAQPFDDRMLSWQYDAGTVSIWTVAGRLKGVRFVGSPGQLKTLAGFRQGESYEARHAAHVNHKISKECVAEAKRTGRGIALEELRGIRDRVRPCRDQRAALSSWPFHQLDRYIAYKAERAGVPVLWVDPAYTSQMCPRCGHTTKANRPTRDHFCCRRCGLAGPADVVAGVNVRNRARSAWVLVNGPALQRT